MKKRFSNSGTSTTKNETSTKKLKLARETLRYLSAPELARAEGGVESPATYTCHPTCIETKI